MHINMHKQPTFRADINGLRAWAVMAVVFFHFGLGFEGGFVGVDVFFVISGYLMTAIIMKGLEAGKFSFFEFCLARARRIFPALITLIAVLLVLGWFWLPTFDYKELGTQSASSLVFLSNIFFWDSAGYFDGAASDKWLLHTWSLSAEWQFYMLLPIFLVILWKFKPGQKTAFMGMIFLFLASLVVSAIGTPWRPSAAYYLLPTRGWEMAVGGIVFFLTLRGGLSDKTRQVFELIAWPVLIASMFLFSSDYQWPGLWALFPVIATALLLLANNNNNPLFANPVAQWLGDRSYSIYLWHWPLIVALHFTGVDNNPFWISVALLASLMFGHISYQLIENRTRLSLSSLGHYKQLFAIGGTMAAVGIMALSVRFVTIEGRISPAVDVAANAKMDRNPRQKECFNTPYRKGKPVVCNYGNDQNVAAVLIGDSHADALISGIGEAAAKYNEGVAVLSMLSCPTIDDIKFASHSGRYQNYCKDFNSWALQNLEQFSKEVPLILVSRTSTYVMGPNEPDRTQELPIVYFSKEQTSRGNINFQQEYGDAIVETACRLVKERPVYLMRPVPEFGIDIPTTLSRKLALEQKTQDITIPMTEYVQRNSLVWSAQDRAALECGVKILDPLPYLCDNKVCYGSRDGRPLYYDDDHMNVYGSRFLIPMFEPIFAKPTTVSNEHQSEGAQQERENLS